MLKIERKDNILSMHDNYTFKFLFMMDMKSIVSSLDKFHSISNPDDATLNK